MITCKSLLSVEALLIELAKSLGDFKASSDSDASWSRIQALLSAKSWIIGFDNFESLWDQPGGIKASVKDSVENHRASLCHCHSHSVSHREASQNTFDTSNLNPIKDILVMLL